MARPELHLPDLPELQLGLPSTLDDPEAAQTTAARRHARARQPWAWRLWHIVTSYLPLMLMALLAAGTWWLVRNTPRAPVEATEAVVRQTPDYTMAGFAITRFGPDGQVVLRIAGDALRHFPANDRLEIEGVRIDATGPDGRSTRATARRALANGDGSEVQLLGGAQVTSQLGAGQVLEVQGEFLHAFVRFQRIQSNQEVRVRHGSTQALAGGLNYDHLQQQLQLLGPVRITLLPAGAGRAAALAAAALPTRTVP